jgi:hypothetical protein
LKRLTLFALLILLALITLTCASSNNVTAVPGAGTNTTLSIPYRKDSNGTTWSYSIFSPAVPKDVPGNIYAKLWDINLKTTKAGKYDYDAYNNNTTQWIVFNESAMSDSFTFAGVCANYADYFIFMSRRDAELLELLNRGVITENNSPTHKWIEYHTARNRYIIDPTWCDWDFVGVPQGIYAGNIEFAEACRTSYNRNALIEAKSKSWFFRHVNTVTEANDKWAHGL